MDVEALIRGLARPEAYPHPVNDVTVVQTHISVVFLAGGFAYKLKKPLDLGFLDFSTPEKRREACEAEVRLNRRLAPGVYLDVVPITVGADGQPRFGGSGAGVEHAVRMRRLPDDRTLDAMLSRGALDAPTLARVAGRLADFHAHAEASPAITAAASFDAVARVLRGNLEQVAPFVGSTVHASVHSRLVELTERELAAQRQVIDDRASRGIPRDTHGDLRLEHVYVLDDVSRDGGDDDIVIVDCIEFSDALRHADPVADAAFLVMDLEFAGRPDLGAAFLDVWVAARGDEQARGLVPLHVAYRHVVRGKVRSIEAGETEVQPARRDVMHRRAEGHFLAALGRLAPPAQRPALVLVGGLPGTGKSTVARGLEREARFARISSDETRKRLAGVAPTEQASSAHDEGIYSAEWSERTFGACLEEADRLLFEGRRVAVDATFGRESLRRSFLALAQRRHVPALLLACVADEADVRARLAARTGDASDADWRVHAELAAEWEAEGEEVTAILRRLPTGPRPEDGLRRALAILAHAGLR